MWRKAWLAGHGRYVYTNGSESQWGPPPDHPDRFEETAGAATVAAFYDDATARLAGQRKAENGGKRARVSGGAGAGAGAGTGEDKVEAHAFHVRNLTNWIKQGLNRLALQGAAARAPGGVSVVDLACGRGQDVTKAQHVTRDLGTHLACWRGADVSVRALEEAERRATARLRPEGTRTQLVQADLGRALLPFPAHEAHLATAHLAAHYFFASEGSLHGLFSNAAHVLAPGACFVLTYTSGEVVVSLMEAAGGCEDDRRYAVGGGVYTFSPRPGVAAALARLARGGGDDVAGAMGLAFRHRMAGNAVDVDEFLTSHEVMVRTAAAHGFTPVLSENLATLAYTLSLDPHMAKVATRMDIAKAYADDAAMDVIRMYHGMVLRFDGEPPQRPGVKAAA